MKREYTPPHGDHFVPSFLPGAPVDRAARPLETPSTTAPLVVDYWRLISREKLKLLIPILAMALVFVAISAATKPTYRASATVMFEGEQRRPVSFNDVYRAIASEQGADVTQAEFLQTREVALRVIRKLDLTQVPEFVPPPPGWLARSSAVQWLRGVLGSLSGNPAVADGEPPNPEDYALGRFKERLDVDRIGQTQLFRVLFESRNPVLAATVANEVVAAYIRADMDARYEATKEANTWLSERLAALERSLDQSEKALQDYRQKHGLLARHADAATDRQLSEISQRLIDARIRRSSLEEAYNQASNRNLEAALATPAIASNAMVMRSREAQLTAEKRLAELAALFGSAHPQYVAASKELQAAQENLRQEIAGAVRTIGRELAAARATEKQIEQALQNARVAGQALDSKEMQLTQLEREVAINRQLYETFLSRNKEISAASDFQQPAARLVDPALPPSSPTRPPLPLVAAMGGAAGAFLGLIYILVGDRMRNTLRTTEDVETRLGEQLLSAVPKLPPSRRARAARLFVKEPDSLFAEAIRTTATGVALATLDGMNGVIAVSSALDGEGKTTIACNLALALASTRRVILIDADLHKPAVCNGLGLDSARPGLSQLLDGRAALGDCKQQFPGTNLSVITAGKIPGNALDLLMGDRLRGIVSSLQGEYDLVIVDTPPLQLVSDTMLLSRVVSAIVMVTHSDRTPLPAIRRALRKINAMRIPVLGVVLNGHDFKRADRYYGENSGYGATGYRYGYGQDSQA